MSCVRWSPNGKAIQYLVTQKGVTVGATNVGRKAETAYPIHYQPNLRLQLALDHTRLLMTRGDITSDAVLLHRRKSLHFGVSSVLDAENRPLSENELKA